MEAETDFKCPMAINDLTGLDNWKPKAMLCKNSG